MKKIDKVIKYALILGIIMWVFSTILINIFSIETHNTLFGLIGILSIIIPFSISAYFYSIKIKDRRKVLCYIIRFFLLFVYIIIVTTSIPLFTEG